jgi:chemotaxis protein methyltransferase CheR
MKAGDAVRGIVRFGRQNLMEQPYPMASGYDMILCRNVLIYLGHENRVRVVNNLLSHLACGGFFFVGHAETLAGIADGPKAVGPNVYVK